jgi:hypothetical protein
MVSYPSDVVGSISVSTSDKQVGRTEKAYLNESLPVLAWRTCQEFSADPCRFVGIFSSMPPFLGCLSVKRPEAPGHSLSGNELIPGLPLKLQPWCQ